MPTPNGGGDPDPRAVMAALSMPAPNAVRRATGGEDTLIWRVEQGGDVFALRVLRRDEDDRCRREIAAMNGAAAAGMPVPALRAHGSWDGRPVLLMDWVSGTTLVDALVAHPAQAHQLGQQFGEIQAALHTVVAPDGLDTRWLEVGGSEAKHIRERLRTDMRTDRLIHLDYHPLNVITDGRRITGVIDWANACAGDPRADIARTLSILRLFYNPPRPLSLAVHRFERGWRSGYAAASGRGVDAGLALYFAWAGLAMMQDQAGKQDQAFHLRAHRWAAQWAARGGCALSGQRRQRRNSAGVRPAGEAKAGE